MKSEVSIAPDRLKRLGAAGEADRPGIPSNGRSASAASFVILLFLGLRPLLDLGPTYGRGADLNSVAGALLLSSILWWLWSMRSSLSNPSPSVYAAGLVAGAALLSVLGSLSAATSLTWAIRIAAVALLFGYAEQHQRLDDRTIWRILTAVLASAVLAGLVGALQALNIVDLPEAAVGSIDENLTRPPGPYPAAPAFSTHMYLGIVLTTMTGALVWRSNRWRSLLPHIATLAALFGWLMVANRSRSPIVALAVALGVFLVVRHGWFGLAVWLLVALSAAAVVDPGSIRADELGAGSEVGAEADTFAWRVGYWKANLPRFWDNPVTGIGLGRVSQLNDGGNPPHSTVVQSIVEMGLAGILSYVAFVVLLGRDLIRRVLAAGRGTRHIVAVGALSLCVGYFLISLSENLLTQLATSGPVAIITGCALGSYDPEPVAE